MSDQETPQPASEEGAPQNARQSGERSSSSNSSGGRERNRGRRRQHAPAGRQLEQSLNMDELRELVELINQYGFTDFELENKDVRVRLRRELAPQVNAQPQGFHQQPVMHAPPPVASSVQSTPVATSAAPQAATPAETQASADAAAAEAEDEALIPIPSPIVGTFYRAPSPTAEPFVRIGSHVSPDTTVCIIEAMKLMNEIQAETTGVVAKIYVENGQPVEYGQPLFGLKK
jgi:acetyl-CoA carboxylase biotin carboxyl carrier protein